MSDRPIYLLDSNIFIQAHRRHYPFDVMPSFWNAIKQLANDGIVKSIDKVKVEIVDKGNDGDELKVWCQDNLPLNFFIETPSAIIQYIEITSWANTPANNYTDRAKAKFSATDYADAWLTALALNDKNYIIVTEEVSAPDIIREIKIPEVCNVFGLPYINTINLLRNLGVSI